MEISFDRSTLKIVLQLSDSENEFDTDLKLVLSKIPNVKFSFNVISVSWGAFRQNLTKIAKVIKYKSIPVVYDTHSKKMIVNALKEMQSFDRDFNNSVNDLAEEELQVAIKSVGFYRQLKPEQLRDAIKLISLRNGANFSVPGAGKTTTILAVHSYLRYIDEVDFLLVVSPVNAFGSWEEELESIFAGVDIDLKRLSTEEIDRWNLQIIQGLYGCIVNYEKLRRSLKSFAALFFKRKVHIILDESHRIKGGVNNQSFNSIIEVSNFAARRDILTGTPMPQGPSDILNQFDFLWPDNSLRQKINKVGSTSEKLSQLIRSKYVRTTKNELNLPPLDIRYKRLPMDGSQKQLYKLLTSEFSRIYSGIDLESRRNFRSIGRSVVKLIQAASNPVLVLKNSLFDDDSQNLDWNDVLDYKKFGGSSKLEYIKSRVDSILAENPSEKVLIWSNFVQSILDLQILFSNYNPVVIYGGVPAGEKTDENSREGRIRKFHDDVTCRVMIANPQACGEGISLHKVCHYAIYFDRNYNAAFFLQSIDRIHRLGLPSDTITTVEILLAENSIDESVDRRLKAKVLAMGIVLDDTYLHELSYDIDDPDLIDEHGLDAEDIQDIANQIDKKIL